MFTRYRKAAALGLAGILALSIPIASWGAGLWPTLPGVGEASFCASYNANTPSVGGITGQQGVGTCVQTVPAGPPAQTGVEQIPADTQLTGGAPPQTVTIASALLGSVNSHQNYIMGGDFATNLWQRGTTPVSAASPATYVMSADRWFAVSASNAMTVSQHAPATTDADYLGNIGFYDWMRVARPSGTPSGSSCVGQILDQKQAADLIGHNGVLSFYGYAPTTFSATNSAISVSIAYYTGGDSATPGTNTATAALSVSGQSSGIANYTAVTAAGVGNTSAVIASGVATINLTTTPTLYAVYGPIPTATSGGTAVTGVIVSFCATPTATSTESTDYFEIEAVQLQAMPGTVTASLPNGVVGYTGFQRISPVDEAKRELAYSYVFNDGGTAGHGIFATGWDKTTAAAVLTVQFPVPMREEPTGSVATATSFAVFELDGATVQACTTLAVTANGALTTDMASMTCATGGTSLTADAGTQLTSDHTGATNTVTFLAEP